jgi:integrase
MTTLASPTIRDDRSQPRELTASSGLSGISPAKSCLSMERARAVRRKLGMPSRSRLAWTWRGSSRGADLHRAVVDALSASPPLDSLGRRRSPATVPGYLAGRPLRTKGRRYPADPPRTEEIIALVRCCGDGLHGARARGLMVVLWRAGLRIQAALDLRELDLDRGRGSVLVRRGKGGRRREVGMDDWGFEQLEP